MGLEAYCRVSHAGATGEGTLQLEEGLLFFGQIRIKIPRAKMTGIVADGGDLVVSYDGGPARFHLGTDAVAAKWAHRLLHPPSLLDKLGVKQGMRVSLIGRFPEDFTAGDRRGAG